MRSRLWMMSNDDFRCLMVIGYRGGGTSRQSTSIHFELKNDLNDKPTVSVNCLSANCPHLCTQPRLDDIIFVKMLPIYYCNDSYSKRSRTEKTRRLIFAAFQFFPKFFENKIYFLFQFNDSWNFKNSCSNSNEKSVCAQTQFSSDRFVNKNIVNKWKLISNKK